MKQKNNNYHNILWIPSAVPFFLFGFMYYLIMPYFAFNFLEEFSVVKTAEKFIQSSYFDYRYIIDCILILFFWIFGYIIVPKANSRVRLLDKFSNFKSAPIILGSLFFTFLFFIIVSSAMSGSLFFSGYSSYDVSVLGQLSTLVLMSVWFIIYFQNKKIFFLFSIIFIVSSIILLGFGARMFFILGAISLGLLYLSKNKKRLISPSFVLSLFSLGIFIVWIGVWRSNMELSSDALVFIFLAEPLFTATSGALYIDNIGGRPFFAFPTDIFASVINFVPTVIFPDKVNVLNSITFNEFKSSPFGASSIIVNMYSNFGIFFPIYFLLMGSFYGFLRKMAKSSIFFRAVYFTLLPVLMFHFFREGFITVFKVIFFNGFILPAVTIFFLYLLFHRKIRVYNS